MGRRIIPRSGIERRKGKEKIIWGNTFHYVEGKEIPGEFDSRHRLVGENRRSGTERRKNK